MGSASDKDVMAEAGKALSELGIPFEAHVMSAHRTPDRVHEFVSKAYENGIRVFIAGAGKSAHLAGVVASLTCLPVIGVPMQTSDLGGLDFLHALRNLTRVKTRIVPFSKQHKESKNESDQK